ncbi:MAG: AtpZ/AtpI family protein [Deltaproteobacteria bacterium]
MQQDWKGINRYATVGLEFGLSLLVGLFAGRWLQEKLGTGNWLTFVGFGFGIAAGYRAIYRAAKAANRDAEREEAEERAERQRYHDEPSRASSDRSAPDDTAADDPASSNGAPSSKHDLH